MKGPSPATVARVGRPARGARRRRPGEARDVASGETRARGRAETGRGEGRAETTRRRRRWRSRWTRTRRHHPPRAVARSTHAPRRRPDEGGASGSGPAGGDASRPVPSRRRERPGIPPRPESTRDQRRIRRDRSRADVKRESRKCLSRRSDPLFGDDRAGGPDPGCADSRGGPTQEKRSPLK